MIVMRGSLQRRRSKYGYKSEEILGDLSKKVELEIKRLTEKGVCPFDGKPCEHGAIFISSCDDILSEVTGFDMREQEPCFRSVGKSFRVKGEGLKHGVRRGEWVKVACRHFGHVVVLPCDNSEHGICDVDGLPCP